MRKVYRMLDLGGNLQILNPIQLHILWGGNRNIESHTTICIQDGD